MHLSTDGKYFYHVPKEVLESKHVCKLKSGGFKFKSNRNVPEREHWPFQIYLCAYPEEFWKKYKHLTGNK